MNYPTLPSARAFHSFMKPSLLLLLLAIAHIAVAQVPDSVRQRYDSIAGKKMSRYDSVSRSVNQRIDDVQQRATQLTNPDLKSILSRRTPKKLSKADSIQALNEFTEMKSGVQHKIDSLHAIGLPSDKYTRKLDSLNQVGPEKYIQWFEKKQQDLEDKVNKPVNDLNAKVNQPIDKIEDQINRPVDKIENSINDKLSQVRNEAGEGGNIPGNLNAGDIDVTKASLPSTDLGLNTDLQQKLPNTNLDVNNPLSKIDNPVGGQMGELNGIKEKASDLKGLPQQQIDKVKSVDAVQGAQQKVGDLNKTTDKLQAYQGDAKNIASGDLGEVKTIPDALEKKASSLDEIKELQAQSGEITKAQEMLKAGNDPEAMKQLAMQQLSPAKDHFAGKEQVLTNAMEELTKLKKKYDQVTSLTDLKKRPPNPMKGKPFIERIVPGVALQIQKSSTFLVDFNPYLTWLFSRHISAGAGWNDRLAFAKWNQLSPTDRIYGPRVFGTYNFKKGFSAKAEIEKMNTLIPQSTLSTDAGTRQWVWSAFVGIKKDYKFIKSVNGNVQILYNLYDDHDNSPYFERLNVRVGFEFPMKKKATSKKP